MQAQRTKGALDGVNGLPQLAKRMARGFRCFQLITYLKASKLRLNLPRSCNEFKTVGDKTQRAPNEFRAKVAREGIEPPTRGFSVLCSTN